MSTPLTSGTVQEAMDRFTAFLTGDPIDVVVALSYQMREAAEPGIPSSYQSGPVWLSELTLPG